MCAFQIRPAQTRVIEHQAQRGSAVAPHSPHVLVEIVEAHGHLPVQAEPRRRVVYVPVHYVNVVRGWLVGPRRLSNHASLIRSFSRGSTGVYAWPPRVVYAWPRAAYAWLTQRTRGLVQCTRGSCSVHVASCSVHVAHAVPRKWWRGMKKKTDSS